MISESSKSDISGPSSVRWRRLHPPMQGGVRTKSGNYVKCQIECSTWQQGCPWPPLKHLHHRNHPPGENRGPIHREVYTQQSLHPGVQRSLHTRHDFWGQLSPAHAVLSDAPVPATFEGRDGDTCPGLRLAGTFLLGLQGHSLKLLLKNWGNTQFARGEDAMLGETEHLTWTLAWRGRARRPCKRLDAQRSADINLPCATCVHSLYFGQDPSKPISLGGGVSNGSSLNLGLQSLPPHHIS